MPRTREAIDEAQELQTNIVETYKQDLVTVYGFGLCFLELLDDVEKQRGNYHTVGANRLHTKFLVTSNCNSEKFYAGGARALDVLLELFDEYNWSSDAVADSLQGALEAFSTKKGGKVSK